MPITLSVIIPVYNVEAYLEKCVDSVLAQERVPDEIILVDDGSTDSCGAICDCYAAHEPRIRVIHQQNSGAYAARNAGLKNVTGDYVTFVDSDDWIEPNMYKELLALAIREQADIVSSGSYANKGKEQYLYLEDRDEGVFHWSAEEMLAQTMSYRYTDAMVWNKLFRRELLNGIQFPKVVICEDVYFCDQVIPRARTIIHTTKPYYHYVQQTGSITRIQDERKIRLRNEAARAAAQARMEMMASLYPSVLSASKAYTAFVEISCYNDAVRHGQQLEDHGKAARRCVARNLPHILANRRIPAIKRCQAMVFVVSPHLYRRVIRKAGHR